MMRLDRYKWLRLFENPLISFTRELEIAMAEQKAEKKLTLQNCRHAFEYFKFLNEAPDDQRESILQQIGKRPPLDMLLSLNFSPRIKLDLPEGMPRNEDGSPAYKADYVTHPDMMTPLATQMSRLKSCLPTSQIRKFEKEKVFLTVLEYISPKEAEILCACKDKALQELYPNITADLVGKVFPNYVK